MANMARRETHGLMLCSCFMLGFLWPQKQGKQRPKHAPKCSMGFSTPLHIPMGFSIDLPWIFHLATWPPGFPDTGVKPLKPHGHIEMSMSMLVL